jgi:hypothetical protein
VTGPGVVSLPRTYDVLAAVGVAESNFPFEDVPPVLRLAGIVGEALEELGAAKTRWYRLEVDIVVVELLNSPFVVAQHLCGYLVL